MTWDKDRENVCMCRDGVRKAKAQQELNVVRDVTVRSSAPYSCSLTPPKREGKQNEGKCEKTCGLR